MRQRRAWPRPVLAGLGLAGVLALGACSGPDAAPFAAPSTTAPAPGPCGARHATGGGTLGTMSLSPQVQAEINRLRALPPEQQEAEGQASRERNPQLHDRLATARHHVTRSTGTCADR